MTLNERIVRATSIFRWTREAIARQLLRILTENQRQTIEQLATDLGLKKLLSEVLTECDEIDIE
jgi:hypothetical protein